MSIPDMATLKVFAYLNLCLAPLFLNGAVLFRKVSVLISCAACKKYNAFSFLTYNSKKVLNI